MSEKLKALREQRAQIAHDMRSLMDRAEIEKRDMTAEELDSHGKLFDRQDTIRKQIEAEERQIEMDRQLASLESRSQPQDQRQSSASPEERSMIAFRNFLKTGQIAGEGSEELRTLQAGSDPDGGYLTTPQQFITTLLKSLDDQVFIRSKATKFMVPKAASIGVPTLDADPDDFEWTSELASGSTDNAMKFGQREMKAHPLAKRIKVSRKLIRSSALPVENIIMQRLAYKLAITQEKNYLLGDGASKPLGMFTASNDGIPTSRDISTGNTSTSLTFDGLIAAKFSLKSGYWQNGTWLFHRDAVRQIVTLKDAEGQYLWQPSVRDGEPDTILGRPMMISEYVPNTFTTGQYVGMFADLSYYWILDSLDLQIQRLVELYAEANLDGFIARYEGDGAPVMPEAFARIKLA